MAPPATARHGSASRWRAGCHCAKCTRAHLADLRTWRRTQGFDEATAELILTQIRAGAAVAEVAEATGVSWQAIRGRGRWDARWQRAVDAALMDGRDPDLDHGTEGAWRHDRCRCPECRHAHHDQG